MAQSFEFIKEQLKGGKFNPSDLPLSEETENKLENIRNKEHAELNLPSMKFGAKAGKMFFKTALVIGFGVLVIKPIYETVNNSVQSASADPAHYSANPLSSNFWNRKGDENAPVSNDFAKEWLANNIKPLHSVIKQEIAPSLDQALSDKKLTLKETVDLSNKISDLNHKFFGTEFPTADAKTIIPVPKPKI